MKKIYLLFAALLLVQISYSQSWPFLGSAGQGLNTQLGINASDILAVSDNEVYTAVYQLDAFANNKVLNLYKYDGNTWSQMSSLGIDGSIIGRVYLLKSSQGNLFVAYSRLGSQSNYNIFIKKLVNGNFVSVGDSLPLTSGINYFGFEVDNNDIPLVLGSKTSILDPAKISKYENGTWNHYTIPNSGGVTIEEKNTFVDAQNNLIFLYAKSQMVGGVFVTSVFLDTFTNNTVTSGKDMLNTKFMTASYMLRDANNNITIFNKEGGIGQSFVKTYTYSNNTWNESALDTVPLNLINGIAMSASGKIVLSNSDGKIYTSPNFNSPVSNPDAGTYCLRLTCSGEKGYAIYNTGVVSGDLNSVVGLNLNTFTKLKAYPNPTKDILYIDNHNTHTINVYSYLGKLVLQSNNAKSIDLSSLETGLYIIESLSINGEVARAKVHKQ